MAEIPQNKQGRFELPDIYVILFSFIVFVSILTWIIPAGAYDRTVLPNGRETVVAGSYRVIEQTPVGIMDIVTSIPNGLTDASSIVFLVLLVGGAVGVVRRTGVIDLWDPALAGAHGLPRGAADSDPDGRVRVNRGVHRNPGAIPGLPADHPPPDAPAGIRHDDRNGHGAAIDNARLCFWNLCAGNDRDRAHAGGAADVLRRMVPDRVLSGDPGFLGRVRVAVRAKGEDQSRDCVERGRRRETQGGVGRRRRPGPDLYATAASGGDHGAGHVRCIRRGCSDPRPGVRRDFRVVRRDSHHHLVDCRPPTQPDLQQLQHRVQGNPRRSPDLRRGPRGIGW